MYTSTICIFSVTYKNQVFVAKNGARGCEKHILREHSITVKRLMMYYSTCIIRAQMLLD